MILFQRPWVVFYDPLPLGVVLITFLTFFWLKLFFMIICSKIVHSWIGHFFLWVNGFSLVSSCFINSLGRDLWFLTRIYATNCFHTFAYYSYFYTTSFCIIVVLWRFPRRGPISSIKFNSGATFSLSATKALQCFYFEQKMKENFTYWPDFGWGNQILDHPEETHILRSEREISIKRRQNHQRKRELGPVNWVEIKGNALLFGTLKMSLKALKTTSSTLLQLNNNKDPGILPMKIVWFILRNSNGNFILNEPFLIWNLFMYEPSFKVKKSLASASINIEIRQGNVLYKTEAQR